MLRVMFQQFLHAWWLAFRELRAEPRTAICLTFAYTGIALPLILLFALKEGAVGVLVEGLIENPRHREIIAVGARSYDHSFIAVAQSLPGMEFFIGDTRNISARFVAVRNPKNRAVVPGLALLPTAEGDPLYSGATPNWRERQALLSVGAAADLGVTPGDRVEGMVERRIDGQIETASVSITIMGIVAADKLGGRIMLAPLPLLEAIEAFIDSSSIGVEDWLSPPRRKQFASFRAYARSIYDVEGVLEALQQLGANARIRSDDAATMLALDRILGRFYWIIAVCGVGGFFVVLASSLRANLERQKPIFGLLRLIGAPTSLRVLIVIAQTSFIVVAGLAFTGICYFLLSTFVNFLFSDSWQQVALAELGLTGVIATIVATLLCALGAALWSVKEAMQIQCIEGLHGNT